MRASREANSGGRVGEVVFEAARGDTPPVPEVSEVLLLDGDRRSNRIAQGPLSSQSPDRPPVAELDQNSPNPFNPATSITFTLPRHEPEVSLVACSITGQLVRTLLLSEAKPPGRYEVQWDGTDEQGRRVASGSGLCQWFAVFENSP